MSVVIAFPALRPAAAAVLRLATPEGAAVHRTDPHGWGLGALAMLELVLLLCLLGPGAWRRVGRLLTPRAPRPSGVAGRAPGRRELWALLGLTAAAFGLRILLSPPAAILSTFNDAKHVHDAMCLAGHAQACELNATYPAGVTALHALLFLPFGPSLWLTYWINAALAALTVPAVWLAGTLLFGGRRSAGWLAALVLTTLPLHIRFSASGALTVGYAAFGTLALAGVLLFARSGRPRHLWIGGVAALLAVQARLEAPAFLLVLAAAAVVAGPELWRNLFGRRCRAHAAFLVVAVALSVVAPVLHVLDPSQSTGGDDVPLTFKLALAVGVPVALGFMGGLLRRTPGARWTSLALGLAGVAALVALLPTRIMPTAHLFDPAPVVAYPDLALPWLTWAERGLPLLNPRAVPAPVLLLALLGFAAALRPRLRAPVAVGLLWWGLTSALGTQKHTGSIPLEHLRTAVSAAPAVALLAAAGALSLGDLLPRGRLRRAALALCAAMALSAPLWSLPMLRAGNWNNERQIRFLERALPTLPERTLVVYPNLTQPGERSFPDLFRPAEVWFTLARAHGQRELRFVGATAALAAPRRLLAQQEDGWTVLWWEGLECRRTGDPDPAVLRPDCREVRERFALEPLATETIPNRMYESDFIEDYAIAGDEVTLQVWQIVGER